MIRKNKLCALPSEIMSLNHKDILEITQINANNKKYFALTKLCIVKTPVQVKLNKDIQVFNGQGLGDTK